MRSGQGRSQEGDMDSLGQYDKNDNIPNRVVKYLLMVKISPSLRGFDYLQTAIELCLKDGAIINHVTSELYPEVAKEFFNTEYGHSLKVRLTRLLIYSVLLFGFFIYFLIDGIMDNNNVSEIILGVVFALFAILFLVGSYYAKVKNCNTYMINNPKKTNKKKK